MAPLPDSRGPLTEWLFALLRDDPVRPDQPSTIDDHDDDLQLALYCCYELHYRGFAGVAAEWEWEPSLLGFRRRLESCFEGQLRELARAPGPPAADVAPGDVAAELWRLAGSGGAPPLSAWTAEHGDLHHVIELAKHRSAYQLKEADPHTWAIPRLAGQAKAVLVAIQSDEYGEGLASAMHAALYVETMEALGLDPTPNAYLDDLPGATLATTNLISLFGLHRRWRGALVGHLALFEMTSITPMGRYGAVLDRLGVDPRARRFYDVHVEADERHQVIAVDGMVAGLLGDEPALAGDVLFGARALQAIEARFAGRVLDSWKAGRSSLRAPATP